MKRTGRKLIALVLAAAMCVMLAGCMAEDLSFYFEPDGSGTLTAGIYMADELIEAMGMTPEQAFANDDGTVPPIVRKTYHGNAYSGTVGTVAFASIEELVSAEELQEDAQISVVEFPMEGRRAVLITITLPSEREFLAESDMTPEELEDMGLGSIDLFTISLQIEFPGGIRQVTGLAESDYVIDGNRIYGIEQSVGESEKQFSVLGFLGRPGDRTGMNNFIPRQYYGNCFTDVPQNTWYTESVARMYEYGLVAGTSSTTFSPNKILSMAEIITLGARVHDTYNGGVASFAIERGDAWYTPYVEYAYETGILEPGVFPEADDVSGMNRPATRAEMAYVIARCLPQKEYPVTKDYLGFADVKASDPYASYIEMLYEAGITVGIGNNRFNPDGILTRSEAVVFIDRLVSRK